MRYRYQLGFITFSSSLFRHVAFFHKHINDLLSVLPYFDVLNQNNGNPRKSFSSSLFRQRALIILEGLPGPFSSSLFRLKDKKKYIKTITFQFFLISTLATQILQSVIVSFSSSLFRQVLIKIRDLENIFQFFLISTRIRYEYKHTLYHFQFFFISTTGKIPRNYGGQLSVLLYFDVSRLGYHKILDYFQFFFISTTVVFPIPPFIATFSSSLFRLRDLDTLSEDLCFQFFFISTIN